MNFNKRVNGSWVDTLNYIHKTSTDTLQTLPADLYADGANATVGLKGNMEQTGTPTPSAPIQPQECGDLETTGEHSGQYKIPIESANTTTPVYLGEVATTRKIKKLVLTGEENWSKYATSDSSWLYYLAGITRAAVTNCICTHIIYRNYIPNSSTEGIRVSDSKTTLLLNCGSTTIPNNSIDDFKSWLADQYTAGTPVAVWYVLATEETGIVNEPLRKIGDYADTVSDIITPTIAGTNILSVSTTLQPSEVTVNYHGWHPVQSVHKRDSNYTIATMQALTIAQLQTHTISDLQGGEWS